MKLILIIGLLCFSNFALARPGGVDVGGSGTGVVKGNVIYLEDLVEQGIEDQQVAAPLSGAFEVAFVDISWIDDATRLVLAAKIHQLALTDRILATAVVKAVQTYSWSFVDDPLVTLQPVDTVLQAQFVQLAIRKPLAIYISKVGWDKMPVYHRAALILHETIEALLAPAEPAIRGRELVGAVFAQKAGDALPAGVVDEINRALPSITTLQTSNELDTSGTWGEKPQTALGYDLVFDPFDQFGSHATAETGGQPVYHEDWNATIFPSVNIKTKNNSSVDYLDAINFKSLTTGLCGSEHRDIQWASYSAYQLSLVLGDSDPVSGPHLRAHLVPIMLMTEQFDRQGCPTVVQTELSWLNQLFIESLLNHF